MFESHFGLISVFESLESTTVHAVILCTAAGDRDVMNKTGMCETSVKYATIVPFSSHSLVQNEPVWLRPEKLKFEPKNGTSFVRIFIEQPLEACRYKQTHKQKTNKNEKHLFFTLAGQLVFSLRLPT